MSIHPEANYLEYVLRTQNLTKQFGEKTAVKNVSMQIKKGEIYGFIGHNGAGKTTTLKSVVGIQQFDSGRITIGGHSIQDDPIACKKMKQALLTHASGSRQRYTRKARMAKSV